MVINNNNLVGLALILLQIMLVAAVFIYKKRLGDQNKKLIQFYLDAKFICKHLIECLTVSDSLAFCNVLIKEIKEYYNLQDILIIDSMDLLNGENNTKDRADIIEYIKTNIEGITSHIMEHHLLKISAVIGGKQKVLYVSHLMEKDDGSGMVVCIEDAPSLLTEQEKTSLENCINLLKTRLLYE